MFGLVRPSRRRPGSVGASSGPGRRAGRRGAGQVVVEMLLILPVFLTIVFTIMELGNLAFWVIIINHSTYEVARIGAMIATPKSGGPPTTVTPEMQSFMDRIVRGARVESRTEPTLFDPQAGVQNRDLVVTGSYDVPLIFPISNILLAKPKGSGRREISTTVRMPIEQPVFK